MTSGDVDFRGIHSFSLLVDDDYCLVYAIKFVMNRGHLAIKCATSAVTARLSGWE